MPILPEVFRGDVDKSKKILSQLLLLHEDF